MKKLLLVVLAAASVSLASAQIQVGAGAHSSFLVIEAPDFGAPLVFEYLYDWDPLNPLDSHALMVAVEAGVADLHFDFINYGSVEDPSYFINAITYQSMQLVNTAWPTIGPFWEQWVSGGQAGYPTAASVDSGSWAWGSGLSAPYRYIKPGSWDGLVFNEGGTEPSVAPIPEPAVVWLLLGAAGAMVLRRRRRLEFGHFGGDAGGIFSYAAGGACTPGIGLHNTPDPDGIAA